MIVLTLAFISAFLFVGSALALLKRREDRKDKQ